MEKGNIHGIFVIFTHNDITLLLIIRETYTSSQQITPKKSPPKKNENKKKNQLHTAPLGARKQKNVSKDSAFCRSASLTWYNSVLSPTSCDKNLSKVEVDSLKKSGKDP